MTYRFRRRPVRRSGFEETFEAQLKAAGVEYVYEKERTFFTPPLKRRAKTWDWWIFTRSGKLLVIETKGFWPSRNRLDETECIRQNPDLDVRYVFMDSRKTITPNSKTTYATWCQKHDILYADSVLPQEWLNE